MRILFNAENSVVGSDHFTLSSDYSAEKTGVEAQVQAVSEIAHPRHRQSGIPVTRQVAEEYRVGPQPVKLEKCGILIEEIQDTVFEECGLQRAVGNENRTLCPDIGGAGKSFISPDAESPRIAVPGKDIEHPFSGRPYLNHIAESYAFRRYIHELTLFPEIYGNEIVPRHQEGIPGIVRGDLVNFPVLHIGLGDRPPDSRETAQSHRCGDPDIIRTSRNNLHYDIAGQ